jgi:hypothetical protein
MALVTRSYEKNRPYQRQKIVARTRDEQPPEAPDIQRHPEDGSPNGSEVAGRVDL